MLSVFLANLQKLSRNAPLLEFRLFSNLYFMFNKCSALVSSETLSVLLD